VALAAAAGPKRREARATGARQKKSVSRLLSAESRWRTCEEAFAAAAGPKRREALATGARHRKKNRWRFIPPSVLYYGNRFITLYRIKSNSFSNSSIQASNAMISSLSLTCFLYFLYPLIR
jgi:predicted Ser/Thr protein kinase